MDQWLFVPHNGGAFIKKDGATGYVAQEYVANRSAYEDLQAIVRQANVSADLLRALYRLAHDCGNLNNPMTRDKLNCETLPDALAAISRAEKA